MRTLTIFLLVFCIVAVSSRFFPSDYVTRFHEYFPRCTSFTVPRPFPRVKPASEKQDEIKETINKVEDNIVPPENDIPLLIKHQLLRQRFTRAADEEDCKLLVNCPGKN